MAASTSAPALAFQAPHQGLGVHAAQARGQVVARPAVVALGARHAAGAGGDVVEHRRAGARGTGRRPAGRGRGRRCPGAPRFCTTRAMMPGEGGGRAGGAAGDLEAAAGLHQVAVVMGGRGQGHVGQAAVLVLGAVAGHARGRLPAGLRVDAGGAAAGGPEPRRRRGRRRSRSRPAPGCSPGPRRRPGPGGRPSSVPEPFVELGAAHRHVVGGGGQPRHRPAGAGALLRRRRTRPGRCRRRRPRR